MAGERWQFTKSQLANTPSRKCGIDSDKELSYRQQAANLIQDMGQRLQVNQLCINTSIVYMHRFYVFQSFTRFHRNSIAPACLFLAAKVEEQPRKLEHVIKVAYLCLHRESPHLDTKSETYLELAQDLVVNENILLQTMGFEVTVDHPHIHVVNTCELVRATRDLAQTSYFLATNSLHLTTMSLQYKPPVVAIVCIYLACKWSGWEIPRSAENKDWFWYVDKEVTVELLEELSQEFLNILDKCPSRLKRKIMGCKAGMKEVKEESDDAPSEKKVKQESEETVSNSKSAPQPSTSAISQHDETAASTSADLIGYSPKASDLGALSMFDSPTKPQTPTKSAAESSGSLKREGSQVHVTSLKEYRERKEREKHERDSHPQKTAHVKQSELLKKTIKSEPQDQVGELSAHHSAVEKPRENIFSQFGPQIKLKLEPSDSQVKSKAISQDPPIKIKIEALSQLDKKLDRSASSQPNDSSEQKTHHRIKTESSSSSKVEHTHSDNMEGAKHYHVKTDHKSPKLHIKLGRQSPVSSVSSDKQMTSSPIKIKIKTSGLNKPEKSEHAKHEKHSKHEKRRSQQHSSTDNGTNHKGDLKLKISTANLTASSSVKVKSPVKVNDHSSKHKMKNSKDKHNLSRSELNQHSSHHSRVAGAGLDNSASSHRKRPHSPEKGKSYSSSTVKYPRTSDRSSGSSSSQVGPVDMDICTTPSDPFTNESIIGTAGFTASNGSGTNSPAMLVRSSSNNDLSQLKVHLEHLIEMQKSHIAANILSPQSGPTQPPPLPPPPPPPFSIMGKDINKTTLYPGQSMPDYPPLPPPPPSPPPPPPPL